MASYLANGEFSGCSRQVLMPRIYAKGRKRRFQGNQYTLTQMKRAARDSPGE